MVSIKFIPLLLIMVSVGKEFRNTDNTPKKQDNEFSSRLKTEFTKMTRRKYTSKFRTKVVPEALKERSRVAEPAQKYAVAPPQISLWKTIF